MIFISFFSDKMKFYQLKQNVLAFQIVFHLNFFI